ncbi:hypothetical protein ACHHYP_11565 [Achlya hypogyna]|uniref:Uncharacterized protein n=1 Tax=Achlya hypogyna TaxID=1202772 RepID=A0A1V9ZHZ8_ACHHY|nr:hypothetical protein ACHHYP_11565 [Achlya hypogyna]
MAARVAGTLAAVERLRPDVAAGSAAPVPVRYDANGIAIGRWSVHLTNYDPFSFYMAAFCMCVPLAQIATRVGLYQYWPVMLGYGIVHMAQWTLGYFWFMDNVWSNISARSASDVLYSTWSLTLDSTYAFIWYGTILGALTFRTLLRWQLRRLFHIPGKLWEDIITNAGCSCCAVSQMAQHTTAYIPGELLSVGPKDTLPGYEAL